MYIACRACEAQPIDLNTDGWDGIFCPKCKHLKNDWLKLEQYRRDIESDLYDIRGVVESILESVAFDMVTGASQVWVKAKQIEQLRCALKCEKIDSNYYSSAIMAGMTISAATRIFSRATGRGETKVIDKLKRLHNAICDRYKFKGWKIEDSQMIYTPEQVLQQAKEE